MLAEKCPNCGAFLPVRRAGVAIRTCEFCELEVPGEVVEVERLTMQRPAVQPPPDVATSDWLPPTPRIYRVERVARAVRRGVLTFVVVLFVGIGLLVAGILYAVNKSVNRATGALHGLKTGPAEAPPPREPKGPPPRPEQVALTGAVQAAGGVKALDPITLLAFADRRARAVAGDALLTSVQCFPVRAGGLADLTLADGRCSYEYRSPAGTVRPADVPVGVAVDYPCIVEFDVDKDAKDPDARASRYSIDMCRAHHAVRPPRCTVAEVWARATAAGAPADAVGRMRYAGRYRSGYDPVDPDDEFDHPERGRWTVSIERDGAPDIDVDTADDCGQSPPTADEKAVLAALKKAYPALHRCFAGAVGGERSVEALEMIWRFTIDAGGAVTIAFADPGVDIEGMFEGDLDGIRATWAKCAAGVGRTLRLPAALRQVRLELRLQSDDKMIVGPPPFD